MAEAPEPNKPYDRDEITARLTHLTPQQRRGFWALYTKSQNTLTRLQIKQRKELLSLFSDAADDISMRVQSAFEGLSSDTWDLQTMRRLKRDEALFNQIRDRIRALGGEMDKKLEQSMLKSFKQAWSESGHRLAALTPPSAEIAFGMLPDEQIIAMLNRPFSGATFSQRIGIITDEMAHRIKHELLASMVAGESWQSAARRIRGEMGTKGRKAMWRADMIARTEMARAEELANYQFHQENEDIIDKVVWMAHPGCCEICQDLNGTELDGPEDYPPHASHPRCRCDAVAIPKVAKEL